MIAAAKLFALPPFPRGKPHPVARRADQPAPPDLAEAAKLVAAIRAHRIGGTFWQQTRGQLPDRIYDARDDRALIAAIKAEPFSVSGSGPYAGLRSDGDAITEDLAQLVARIILSPTRFCDPFNGASCSVEQLVGIFSMWRALIDANRPIAAAFGFARWKQDTAQGLLWGGAPVNFARADAATIAALPPGRPVAVWKARVPADALDRLEASGNPIVEVEDGFIRSIGLGANCVPPLSIICDPVGVHYDPARPSALETLIEHGDIPSDLVERARHLRETISVERISKYGRGGTSIARPGGDRRHILVAGQVEDDRSVRFGGGDVRGNLDLLHRVRTANPDAFIVYRPHPDVEAGHRKGHISAQTALSIADMIDSDHAIGDLTAMVDEVHVLTSLAGFEALMAGKHVTTYGTPFYAGWGLTHDVGAASPRRTARPSIDALSAAALLVYPRYLDPVTFMPCPAEVLVQRIKTDMGRKSSFLVSARRLQGWIVRQFSRVGAGA